MYLLLTLFFISLFGITFMIGRKLVMLRSGQLIHHSEETVFKPQYIENLKQQTIKNIKRHGYSGLVATIRFYFRSSNLVKNKYQEAKIKMRSMGGRNLNNNSEEKQEISKFLKIISEYKHKIRKIKHKIREEEKNL